ncbi:MAG: hypothetical protein QOG68_1665, partial [Solirubrobacteraceae bacterium]|nr:hypothetical protein [Solirubrobacteraceae bacterium]
RLLTEYLGPSDSLLLYPEGTRCTAKKLARAKEIIAERQPELADLAERLHNVLPPRLGGALTLLEHAPEADVVIFGHVGLDGFEYISDIWGGGLVGSTVTLKFWRFPASEVPDGRDERIAWLYERWQELDDWIGMMRAGGTVTLGTKAAAAAPAGYR